MHLNDFERESFPSNDNMPKDLPADAILMQFTRYWCNFFFPCENTTKIPWIALKWHGLLWAWESRQVLKNASKTHRNILKMPIEKCIKMHQKCISLPSFLEKKVSWKILIHICSMWHIIKYDKIVRPTNVKCVISNCKGQEMSLWHTLELFKLTLGLIWK